MVEFNQIFYSDSVSQDVIAQLNEIFTAAKADYDGDEKLRHLSEPELCCFYYNITLRFYFVKTVLFDLDDVLNKFGIIDTATRREFMINIASHIEANKEAIFLELKCTQKTTEMQDDKLKVDLSLDMYNYAKEFKEIQIILVTEVHNNYINYIDRITSADIKILEILYAYCRDNRFDYEAEELGKVVMKIEKEFKTQNIIEKYGIIVEYFKQYAFNGDKFKSIMKWRFANLSKSNYDMQLRYILSVVPKNKEYDRKKKAIIAHINEVEATMKKIQKEIDSAEKPGQIYDRYQLSEQELDANIISELE